MNTYDTNTLGNGTGPKSGFGFWKVLAVIIVGLIVLSLLWPLIKGLFWLGVVALAIYGGYMLFRASKNSSGGSTL